MSSKYHGAGNSRPNFFNFVHRHYKKLYVLCAIILPTIVPIYFWNEYWLDSLLTAYFARSMVVLNLTWTVNSAAHLWGTKPYDQ